MVQIAAVARLARSSRRAPRAMRAHPVHRAMGCHAAALAVELLFDAGCMQTQVRIEREWASELQRGLRDVRGGATEPRYPRARSRRRREGDTSCRWAREREVRPRERRRERGRRLDPAPRFLPHMLGASYFQFFGEGALLVPEHYRERRATACLTFTASGATGRSRATARARQRRGMIRGAISPADLRAAPYLAATAYTDATSRAVRSTP